MMLTVHSHNFSYIRKNYMTLVCRLEALAQRSRKEATQSRRGKLTEEEKSFKHACNQIAVSQCPVSSGGQPLTPTVLRRMGNCPPPARAKVASVPRARAGRATQAIPVLSWNAGHLGQQQWSEMKSWLSTEASQTCDAWFCRKHTGRPPQNFLPQDGIAFRLHLQTTRLRPQRARTRPTSLRRRRYGLRAVRTRHARSLRGQGRHGRRKRHSRGEAD